MDSTKLLQLVFEESSPKYTSFQFSEMINVGLVVSGVKRGALLKLGNRAVHELQKQGLYVVDYPLVKGLTFVSKKNPKFSKHLTHQEVGHALGYMTPIDIVETPQNAFTAHIEINFRRKQGKRLKAYVLNQVIIDKSESQILKYLEPYVKEIQRMNIPNQFTIMSIELVIKKVV